MARLAGVVEWREPGRPDLDWAGVLAILGPGAADCSPPRPGARLGVWTPGARPPSPRTLATSPEATVAFAGYLTDLPADCPGEAAHVLARYRNGDWSWLRGANGVFAAAVIDHREARCALAVDRLGIRPLLYAADGTGAAFGSDLAAVAAARPRPRAIDHDALQELTAIGFPLGEHTVLAGIERVPPGSWVELSAAGRRVTRYWSLGDLPAPRAQAVEAFVDESQSRLRAAIVRLARLGEPPALCPLSAGYDSRRILLEGHAAGVPFETITALWRHDALPSASIEPAVAAELCRHVGAPGRLVPAVGPADRALLERDRALRDALLDWQVPRADHLWAVPMLAELPTAPARVSFDGMAGDTFFNNPFYALPRALWGRWRAADDVVASLAPDHRFWDGVWGGLVSRPLAERLRAALDALPEGPARLSHFYLLGRTRRVPALLPYGLLDLRIESVCPYLDHDVMDHAATLEPIVKAERRLQRVALERHFPELAGLPSSHSPAAEIPEAYRAAMAFADPDAPRRFTADELRRLIAARRGGAALRRPSRDLAFAALSALGLGRTGGGWREERVRRLLFAHEASDRLGRGDAAELARARRDALDWLARRRHAGRASTAL